MEKTTSIGRLPLTRAAVLVMALAVFFVPVFASAQEAPNPVTGITAEQRAEGVYVQWDPVLRGNVSHYRVYFSRDSILNNDGLYDDYEETEGSQNFITLATPKGQLSLYVAVLAVSESGQESAYFIEEASIELPEVYGEDSQRESIQEGDVAEITEGGVVAPPAIEPTPVADPPVAEPTTAQPEVALNEGYLQLLSAEPTSATSVTLHFSVTPTVDPEAAPQALVIHDGRGGTLAIRRIVINNQTIVVETAQQSGGSVYRVEVREPFAGRSGEPLDPTDRSTLFKGYGQPNPAFPPEVRNLKIQAGPEADGTYTLIAAWEVDNSAGDLLYLVVRQTRDGGQTFGQPEFLPVELRGVQLSGITPGPWGIAVHTINAYGYVSQGNFQNVILPGGGQPAYGIGSPFGAELLGGDLLMETRDEGDELGSAIGGDEADVATIDAMPEVKTAAPSMQYNKVRLAIVIGVAVVIAIGIGMAAKMVSARRSGV